MNRIKKSIKYNSIALLFTFLGIEIMLSSYMNEFTYSDLLFIGILNVIFFFIYDIIDEKKESCYILYLILTIAVLIISWLLICILAGGSVNDFISWLSGKEYFCSRLIFYNIVTMFLATFIFSSMYYYFTVKLVRMPVLILLVFISLIIYIRGAYSGRNYFVEAYIVSFFIVYIKGNIASDDTNSLAVNTRVKHSFPLGGAIIAIIFFIGLLIAQYVKFPEIESLSYMRAVLRDINLSSILNGYSIEDSDSRSIDKSIQENKDYILYSYKGNNTKYLVKKTYDFFDNNDNKWIKIDKGLNNEDKNRKFPLDITIDKTKDILKSSNGLNNELEKIKEAQVDKDFIQKIIIKSNYSNVKEMPHPNNTYFVSAKTSEDDKLCINESEEILKDNGTKFDINYQYNMYYAKDEPAEGSQEDEIMKYFNDKRYRQFLEQTGQNQDEEYTNALNNFTSLDSFEPVLDLSKTFDAKFLFNDSSMGIKYSAAEGFTYENGNTIDDKTLDKLIKTFGMSDEMLAYKITKDKQSTYDKAKAIQDYLKSSEFKYSLKLDKPKDGNYTLDYFLFTSKKGYCVQFATAMTFLCRIEGIPARYVEGYLVTNDDKTSSGYNVNAKKAHAFTEVYIPGYGWKIFDATPGLIQNSSSSNQSNNQNKSSNSNNKNFEYSIPVVSISSVFVLGVITILILHISKRKRKIAGILKKSTEEALEGIINDSVLLIEKFGTVRRKEETLLVFSKRVDKNMEIGFSAIVDEYYKMKYGGRKIDNQVVQKAVKVNQEIYEKLRK